MTRKIGNNRRYYSFPIDQKRHGGDGYSCMRTRYLADRHLAASAARMISQMLEIALTQIIEHGSAYNARRGLAHNLGKGFIAIKDNPVERQGYGPLAHLLNKKAIRLSRAFQSENLSAAFAIDDKGVDLSAPKRAQRVFRFGKAALEIGNFARAVAIVHTYTTLNYMTLIAALSLPRSDISPMTRRTGAGLSRSSVGEAIICASFARSGAR